MSKLILNKNIKQIFNKEQKNVICTNNNNALGKFSSENDVLKNKLKLDYLYFGYLGTLKQIDEDDYLF